VELQTVLSVDHAITLANAPLEDVVDFTLKNGLITVNSIGTDIFIKILVDQWLQPVTKLTWL
jgi:hypothetical protein